MFLLLTAVTAVAQETAPQRDPLLDRLTGDWVLRGDIDGEYVVHDVRAGWVLEGYYLRFHELSRERDSNGRPAYEAIVFIGAGDGPGAYACLWLDSTGGTGLTNEVIGRAVADGDTLPFVFVTGADRAIHNTFEYRRGTDTWRWTIDTVRAGDRQRFAKVELSRPGLEPAPGSEAQHDSRRASPGW